MGQCSGIQWNVARQGMKWNVATQGMEWNVATQLIEWNGTHPPNTATLPPSPLPSPLLSLNHFENGAILPKYDNVFQNGAEF